MLHERPWLADSLATLLYLLLVALVVIGSSFEPGLTPVGVAVALAVVGAATVLLLRRRHPVIMFATASVLFLLSTAIGNVAEALLPMLAIYSVAVFRSTRAAWLCFAAGVGVAALASLILAMRSRGGPVLLEPTQPPMSDNLFSDWLNLAVGFTLLLLVGTLAGTNVGGRARYVAALVDRAEQLVRERDQQAEIAGARERERIAREMHDVIAHSLSVMISLSEGAYAAAPGRPEQSREAIARVADTGRTTLGEVRRLLGTVRADSDASATRTPQPGAAQLEALAEQIGHAGLPVRMTTTGTPHSDPALGLTVYRIVQESLTNALRHARSATEAVVSVRWHDDGVEITVDDDAAEPPAAGEQGRGLLGMRERAALYGGSVEAGPRDTGGWRVFAQLPTTERKT